MMPTLLLRHQTKSRWRLCFDQPPANLDWNRLRNDLQSVFPTSRWSVRTNPVVGSIIIVRYTSSPPLRQDSRALVFARVVQQINAQGYSLSETPLTPAEVVPQDRINWLKPLRSLLRSLANVVSVSLSLSTLLLACAVFMIGFVGLFIPFSPGIWLLIVATVLFEFALALRRPFLV